MLGRLASALHLRDIDAVAVIDVLVLAFIIYQLLTLIRGDASTSALVVAGGASVLIAAGSGLGRRGDTARRERAWQIQAIGVGLLAAAWLAGIELASGPLSVLGG